MTYTNEVLQPLIETLSTAKVIIQAAIDDSPLTQYDLCRSVIELDQNIDRAELAIKKQED